MLRSDTCFVVLKVSDARKGVESHAEVRTLVDQLSTEQHASQPHAVVEETGHKFHIMLIRSASCKCL